jgi:hypothetical protein
MELDPVEVTARFDREGRVTPLRFTWQGRDYPVEGAGRRWKAEDGLHILVMAAGERVFELLFDPAQGRWFIKSPHSARTHIV